jgi:hypothetical protein
VARCCRLQPDMEECLVSLFCHGGKSRRLCRSRLALCAFFSLATMGTAFAVSCPSANIPSAPSGYSSQSFTSSGGISVSDTSQTGSSSISVSGIPSAQQVLKVAVTLNCLSAGSGNGLNDFAFMLAPPGSSSKGFDFLDGTCDGASNATGHHLRRRDSGSSRRRGELPVHQQQRLSLRAA